MFSAATPPPPLRLLSHFFIISHVYHSPTHFSSPLDNSQPPFLLNRPLPHSTLLFPETGLIALYLNCSRVQRLGGKQDCTPPPPTTTTTPHPTFHLNSTFHFLPHFCPHTPFPRSLPSLYFLSKANTIIHRELSLYSCIKWNVFMCTRPFTCTLPSPNIPTWVCTEWIPLSPILLAFVTLWPQACLPHSPWNVQGANAWAWFWRDPEKHPPLGLGILIYPLRAAAFTPDHMIEL